VGVFLVGFMGAGKTSVGRALSRQLGWAFEDLDERIQASAGQDIEQIFRRSGEAAFRRAETAALRQLLAELGTFPRVVALGGGAFIQADNAALVHNSGVPAVFLDAPVEELYSRCQQEGTGRPLCRDLRQFRALYEQRRPYYMRATLHIETGGRSIAAVAKEVAQRLGLVKRIVPQGVIT
jgi:shikimate kinase